jgi:hypothetical protein
MSTAGDYSEPHHPTAYFSPTEGYFVSTRGQNANLFRVTGRRTVTADELPRDAYSLIPAAADDDVPHEVEQSSRWVAVQFGGRGPALVLHDDGTVTERFTMPADIAHLPLGGAA